MKSTNQDCGRVQRSPVVELLRYLHSDRCNAEPLRNLTETDAGRTTMNAEQPTIIYTLTDEAPLLATYAFLPVIRAFADAAGINVKTSDISVATRILAEFSDYLTEEQRVPDNLAELGELTQLPDTNIIKLPNISASVPQLLAAIKELQAKGYDLPEFPGAAEDRRGKRNPAALRQVSGQRGEPGAARRQLGPPRTQGGQGVRAQAPAQHGRVVDGLAYPRGDHEARRLLPRREVDDPGPRAQREDGAVRPRAARRSCSSPRCRWMTATSSTACS